MNSVSCFCFFLQEDPEKDDPLGPEVHAVALLSIGIFSNSIAFLDFGTCMPDTLPVAKRLIAQTLSDYPKDPTSAMFGVVYLACALNNSPMLDMFEDMEPTVLGLWSAHVGSTSVQRYALRFMLRLKLLRSSGSGSISGSGGAGSGSGSSLQA